MAENILTIVKIDNSKRKFPYGDYRCTFSGEVKGIGKGLGSIVGYIFSVTDHFVFMNMIDHPVIVTDTLQQMIDVLGKQYEVTPKFFEVEP